MPISNATVISVLLAFFASGCWKDGTPLLMASIPVSAVLPEEKARKIRGKA
jgi:hypothetical protein